MKNRSTTRVAACYAILALATTARLSADTPQSTAYQLPPNAQVIAFLLQSADLYRHLSLERQMATEPADVLFLEDNQPAAAQILRLAFEFAKADAALAARHASQREESATGAGSGTSSSDLARFKRLRNQSNEAIQRTTQEIDELKTKIAASHGAERKKLQAAQDEAQGRLELLEAASRTVQDLIDFVQSTGGEGLRTGDLASTIGGLAQTVPELNNPAGLNVKWGNPNFSAAPNPQQSGILGLASEVSALDRKLTAVNQAMLLTDRLAQSAQSLRTPMAGFVSRLVLGRAVNNLQTSDLALIRQQKEQLDALTVELNSWFQAIVALEKQEVLLAQYKSHLESWRAAVNTQYRQAWKKLIVRALIVLMIMALLAGISEASRRLTLRHVEDTNRRHLIDVIQRLVTLLVIVLVGAFGLASDLKSLATFFGLATAGIAVALQNVIVASAGYLLLVGKRGIRIGDRVQISGVTGYVSDIGLLQFQVREFDLQKQQFTGQVATFANSLVLVSPSTGLLKFSSDAVQRADPSPDHQAEAGSKGAGVAA